jgi:hypothetical protein
VGLAFLLEEKRGGLLDRQSLLARAQELHQSNLKNLNADIQEYETESS